MLVLFPKEKDGLEHLEHGMTPMHLGRLRRRIQRREVFVYLPRFRMTSSFFILDEALKSTGMVDACDEIRADFSGTEGAGLLFIAAVLHNAFFDANEEGAEAAAATAVLMVGPTSSPISFSPAFRADRPFFFLIRENSAGSVLFMGRTPDPAFAGE